MMLGRVAAVWISWVVLFSCVVLIVEIPEPVRGATTIYVDDSGGADYTTIQEAIDAAKDGDTVFVYQGIYDESLLIGKRVSITGEDKNTTKLSGSQFDEVRITADYVNITGFNMSYGYDGIRIDSNYNIISNNYIMNCHDGLDLSFSSFNIITYNTIISINWYGIDLYQSGNNFISNNTISDCYFGIYGHQSSTNNIISNNKILNNEWAGIYLESGSHFNEFRNNSISYNGNYGIYQWFITDSIIENNEFIEDGIFTHGSISSWNTHIIENNTANNKPIYYYKDAEGIIVPNDASQVILANCRNFTISGINTINVDAGILIGFSSNITVSDCESSSNSVFGIYLETSSNNTILNNIFMSNLYGIYLKYSSDYNEIISNEITDNEYGIYMTISNNNTISENDILSNIHGAFLSKFDNNNLTNNNISLNIEDGIEMLYSSLNKFDSNIILFNGMNGVSLYYSSQNNVSNNHIISNNYHGIYLNYNSDNNNLTNNEISTNTKWGCIISSSTDAILIDNNIKSNKNGVLLFRSQNNILKGNDFDKNSIVINGDDIDHWSSHDMENNMANGRPIYYYKNDNGKMVPSDAIEVILANCTYFSVNNLDMSEIDIGILVGFSSNNTISMNTIVSNNLDGALISYSSYNNITENNISFHYFDGINISYSWNNEIFGNEIFSNGYGVHIDSGNNNMVTGNIFSTNEIGIWLDHTDKNLILENNFSFNSLHGIFTYHSSDNIISKNTVRSNGNIGIYVYAYSDDNRITENDVSLNNAYGIKLMTYADNNSIYQNDIYSQSIGISFLDSDYNNISSNGIFLNDYGISFESSHYNTIWNNNIHSNNNDGISIESSRYIDILKNNIYNNTKNGILLYAHFTDYNLIRGNNISTNGFSGIRLSSDTNDILENNIYQNKNGIEIGRSLYNDIYRNNIYANDYYGIYVRDFSIQNNISENEISNNLVGGTYLWYITDLTLKSNIFVNNSIIIRGYLLNQWNSHTIEDNIANGRPIYYFKNGDGIVVPEDAAQVILANCTNTTVNGINALNVDVGIVLGYSSNTTITNNTISSNHWNGTYFFNSYNNTISHNEFLSNHLCGIYLDNSVNNTIYNNNFIDNTNHAFNENNNLWNLGYPIGGNYWSDYTGVDEKSGIYQDQPNKDGIGDTPYNFVIDANDNYPLMEPWTLDDRSPEILLLSPLNNSIIMPGVIIELDISDQLLTGYNVSYSLNGGSDLVLTSPFTINTSSWIDDSYIVTITAVDIYGNVNISWFSFVIDSISPEISLDSPGNNSIFNNEAEIKLTITDENLNNVTYSKQNGTIIPLIFPYDIEISDWEDGEYFIKIYADDLAGNSKEKWFIFRLDTLKPDISLYTPSNGSLILEPLTIDFDISDDNLDSASYSLDQGLFQTFEEPYELDTIEWSGGKHIITVRAEDIAGNINEKWYIFTVDTLPPNILLNSPSNESLFLESSILDFDISDDNLDSVSYSLDQGSYQTLEDPYDIDTFLWSDGEHKITIKAEDTAGNIIEIWFIFRKDITPPSIDSSSINDNDEDINVDSQIIIEFSEPMDTESVEDAISISPYIEYSCSWSIDNKTLTITCNELMDHETLYQVSISTKAKDMADRGLEDRFELEFTTEAEPRGKVGEDFPVLYLLLTLVAVVIIVVLILVMVMAKRKKAPASGMEAGVIGEIAQAPQTIQFTCSNCNNLLQVNNIGNAQNVTCPYCSTFLTVYSQAAAQTPQPQYETLPQVQPKTKIQSYPQVQQTQMQISCPKCQYKFSITKTYGPIQVQCPSCGTKGMMR